jgi:AbrB family looped-hinge helix DNA binding protein
VRSSETMQARVSSKGWVVIPATLRRRFGIRPGTLVQFQVTDLGVLVTAGAADPVEDLYGKLAGSASLTKALLEERARERKREEAKLRAG